MTPEQLQERETRLRKAFIDQDFGEAGASLDESAFAGVEDRKRLLMSSAVAGWAGSMMGQRVNPASPDWQGIKDGIARGYFKNREASNVADEELFLQIAEDYKAKDALEEAARNAAARGESWLGKFREVEQTMPNVAGGRQIPFLGLAKETHDKFREKILPYQGIIRSVAEKARSIETSPEGMDWSGMAQELIQVPKESRPFVLEAISRQATANIDANAASRLGKEFARGFERFLDTAMSGVESVGESGPGRFLRQSYGFDVEAMTPDQQEQRAQFMDLRDDIRDISTGKLAKLEDVRVLGMNISGAARNVPMTIGAFVPYIGPAALVGSFQRETANELRRANPTMSRDDIETIATISAPFQALTEVVSDRLLFGKLPNLKRLFTTPAFSAGGIAAQLAGRVALGTATEYAEEFTQGAVPKIVQSLSSDVPDVDWDGYFQDFKDQSPELLATIIPLALFGAGVGQATDYRASVQMLYSADEMMAAKIPEAEARKISELATTGKRSEADSLFRQEFRKAATKGEAPAEMRAAAQRVIAANQAQRQVEEINSTEAENLGVRVFRDPQGWKVETAGGNVISADGAEAARRIRDDIRTASTEYEAETMVALIDDMLTTRPGMRFELRPEVAAATSEGIEFTDPVTGKTTKIKDAKSFQNLRDQAAAIDGETSDASRLILGDNYFEFSEGIARVFRRARGPESVPQMITAAHEVIENSFRRGLVAGQWTEQDARNAIGSLIPALESGIMRLGAKATGEEKSWLDNAKRAVAEGDSNLVREVISELGVRTWIGRDRDGNKTGLRPGTILRALDAAILQEAKPENVTTFQRLRAWFKAVGAYLKGVVATAKIIRDAERNGTIDDFTGFLDKVLGIETATREENEVKDGVIDMAFSLAPELKSFSLSPQLFLSEPYRVYEKKPGATYASPVDKVRESLAELTESPVMHETNLAGARKLLAMMMGRMGRTRLFVTNDPALALGQGGAGIKITFNPARLNGNEPNSLQNQNLKSVGSASREFIVEKFVKGAVQRVEGSKSAIAKLKAEIPLLGKFQESENGTLLERVAIEENGTIDDFTGFLDKVLGIEAATREENEVKDGVIDMAFSLAPEMQSRAKPQSIAPELQTTGGLSEAEGILSERQIFGLGSSKPIILYHGGPLVERWQSNEERLKQGAFAGFHLTENPDVAEQYRRNSTGSNAVVTPYYARIRKVWDTRWKNGPPPALESLEDWQQYPEVEGNRYRLPLDEESYIDAAAAGYDGVISDHWMSDKDGTHTGAQIVVFDPAKNIIPVQSQESQTFSLAPTEQDAEYLATAEAEIKSMLPTDVRADYQKFDDRAPILWRGETTFPAVRSVKIIGADSSGKSRSIYPSAAVTLANGGVFVKRFRVSDHAQVSQTAFRQYDLDYRLTREQKESEKAFDKRILQSAEDDLISAARFAWEDQMKQLRPLVDANYGDALERQRFQESQKREQELKRDDAMRFFRDDTMRPAKVYRNKFGWSFQDGVLKDDQGNPLGQFPNLDAARFWIRDAYFESSRAADGSTFSLAPTASPEEYSVEAFHGTDSRKFDQFDILKLGKGSGNDGLFSAGFYFSPSSDDAKSYGKHLASVGLKVKNPLIVPDSFPVMMRGDDSAEYWAGFDNQMREALRSIFESNGFNDVARIDSVKMDESFIGSFARAYKALTGMNLTPPKAAEVSANLIQRAGFDAVYAKDGDTTTEIVIYDPANILIKNWNGKSINSTFSLSPQYGIDIVSDTLESWQDVFDKAAKRNPTRAMAIRDLAQQRINRLGEMWAADRWTAKGDKIRAVVEKRTKGSLDDEQAMREALALDQILEAEGMNSAAAMRSKDSKDYEAWQRFQESKALILSKGEFTEEEAEKLAGASSSAWRKAFVSSIREAVKKAKTEAAAWRQEADDMQADDWSPRESLVRDMRVLNVALSAFPPEVRAKVTGGSMVKLAGLATERARYKAIQKALEKAIVETEVFMRKEYAGMLIKTLDKAAPIGKPGEVKKSKFIVTVQDEIDAINEMVGMDHDDVATAIAAAEAAIITAQTPEDADAKLTELNLLELFGGILDIKNTSSQEMASALEYLENIISQGRDARKMIDEARRERVKEMVSNAKREAYKGDSGPETTQAARASAAKKSGKAMLKKFFNELSGFDAVLRDAFGPKSKTATEFSERFTLNSNRFEDVQNERRKRFRDFARELYRTKLGAKINQKLIILERIENASGVTYLKNRTVKTHKFTEEEAARIVADPKAFGFTEKDAAAISEEIQAIQETGGRRKVFTYEQVENEGDRTEIPLSQMDALYLSMALRQPGILEQQQRYGYDQETVDQLEKFLTDDAKRWRSWMQMEYDAGYNSANEVYMRMFNTRMPKITFYAPLMKNHQGQQAVLDPLNTGISSNSANPGSIKTRKARTSSLRIESAFSVFWSHFNQMEYWNANAEYLRDVQSVMLNPEVREAVVSAHGEDGMATISAWVQLQMSRGVGKAALAIAGSKMFRNVKSAISMKALALNLSTTLKTIPSAFYSLGEIHMSKWPAALVSGMKHWDRLWKTNIIQRRLDIGGMPELRDLGSSALPMSWVNQGIRYGSYPTMHADGVFTTYSAAMAYGTSFDEAKRQGASDDMAHKYAEERTALIVSKTAQPENWTQKSLFENDASGAGSLFFMFTSDPRQKLALAGEALNQWRKGSATTEEAMRKFLAYWVIPGIMFQLANAIGRSVFKGDDDEWEVVDFATAALVGQFQGLALLGSAAEIIVAAAIAGAAEKITGEQVKKKPIWNSPKNPLDQAAQELVKSVGKITEDDVKDGPGKAWEITKSAGMLLAPLTPAGAIPSTAERVMKDTTNLFYGADEK